MISPGTPSPRRVMRGTMGVHPVVTASLNWLPVFGLAAFFAGLAQ